MLKIRLQRTGRKHEPTFRLVLIDHKNSSKSGRFLEILGNHDFRQGDAQIKKERVLHWISKGVKPTPTVHNLLVSHKVIEGKKMNVLPRRTPKKKGEEKAAAAPSPKPAPAPEAKVEAAEAPAA